MTIQELVEKFYDEEEVYYTPYGPVDLTESKRAAFIKGLQIAEEFDMWLITSGYKTVSPMLQDFLTEKYKP